LSICSIHHLAYQNYLNDDLDKVGKEPSYQEGGVEVHAQSAYKCAGHDNEVNSGQMCLGLIRNVAELEERAQGGVVGLVFLGLKLAKTRGTHFV